MSAWGAEALPEIRDVLDRHRALLAELSAAGAVRGDVDALAERWADADFNAEGVELWCACRCPDPVAARLLSALCVPLEAVGRVVEHDGRHDTLGFQVATGQLSGPAEILVAAGVSTLLLDEPTALKLAAGQQRAVELARAAQAALEELSELLDSAVLPFTANDIAYATVDAIRHAAISIEKLGTRSVRPLADYLEYRPASPVAPDRDGAQDLAERLQAFGEAGHVLHRRGRDEFFGREEFNPSGFGIRAAMKDGRRLEEFLDEHERGTR